MRYVMNQVVIPVGVASTEVLCPNPNRRGLLLGCPKTNHIWFTFGIPAVVQKGILLPSGGQALALWHELIGDTLHQAINAICAGAGENFCALEFLEA